uniref:Ovule protein n=1 Tax=Strongyloides venezuelensis TaxID=75913 RepID=A0A0K0G0D1_STRVS
MPMHPYPPIITIRANDLRHGITPSTYPYNSRSTIFIPQNNTFKPTYSGEAPPPYPGISGTLPVPYSRNVPRQNSNQLSSIQTPILMRLYDENSNTSSYRANDPPPYEDLPGSTNTPQSAIFYPITPDPSHVLPQKQ